MPFLESVSLMKRKRKAMKRIKQSDEIFKKGSSKKKKMVIDLPYKGRKVEGSWKCRRRERVPKAGSRREETINEPINSWIGEFQAIIVGK